MNLDIRYVFNRFADFLYNIPYAFSELSKGFDENTKKSVRKIF